jgi:hypothetical protein
VRQAIFSSLVPFALIPFAFLVGLLPDLARRGGRGLWRAIHDAEGRGLPTPAEALSDDSVDSPTGSPERRRQR